MIGFDLDRAIHKSDIYMFFLVHVVIGYYEIIGKKLFNMIVTMNYVLRMDALLFGTRHRKIY